MPIMRQAQVSNECRSHSLRTLADIQTLPGFAVEHRLWTHTSCNQTLMTRLLMACFPNPCETLDKRSTYPVRARPPLNLKHRNHSIPLQCRWLNVQCRVQFAKLQVFCTCKYSLITAIKEDYGRLADGECNVVLIRVWMHCNTNRMLTPSEQNWLLDPDKLYPDVDFSKLIITCS